MECVAVGDVFKALGKVRANKRLEINAWKKTPSNKKLEKNLSPLRVPKASLSVCASR